ncbi:structural maintenance of chromosomes flexible hinge domain-containing protein 1 [Denticeps clupeoides]|uniref:structural maintenance of chromosomes flexible hinge domain-containing protein 1 n=1 Tax=Denticeps clupeoides TaxID=299321 RepID=UPI0010A49094|nr:structural maintenance of chromosomes flexible hinge domain-containing protein 1 [Denticeps clupeoides]
MAADGAAPRSQRAMRVFDCRHECAEVKEALVAASSPDLRHFLQAVSEVFSIPRNEAFVLTTTDRRIIDGDRFNELCDGNTLHVLRSVDQVLPVATQERIEYLPHYHTLVQSGMYEYYASEGQKSLPYAFAELIDNALSATARNAGTRTLRIRLLFDESQGKHAIVVTDNGHGMTSKQLNNWAVYRMSKFTRENSIFHSDHSGYVRPDPVPRSLNSDISYFGVGGKQAVFYIGQSVRIITKPIGSPDVHEFVMSKEDFERKERNKEEIYCGFIRNRKPGDGSHVTSEEERFLHSIIAEEEGQESFTVVVITGVQPEHITYLKQHFSLWTRELAHIYHYYVHGIHGNDMRSSKKNQSNIDIQITLVDKAPRPPRTVNLRDVDSDMQTLYINSSVASFEFKACAEGDAMVEGLVRYHPFLYDKETYPDDPYADPGPVQEEDDDDCILTASEGRAKRPLFECFWNGRLIPYTTVSEFDWCARPKKAGAVPLECYNRLSGVLFANDRFPITTNKLTFMDLELQLRNKETIFTRLLNGQEQRVKIHREFAAWLKECHECFDKQVKFIGFHGLTSRQDVSVKRLQSPWARYSAIQWDGKKYTSGQYVKSIKTQPVLFGTIDQFLLYGNHEGDVYATGGHVQITLQPKELYDEVRTIPITKIDRQAPTAVIKSHVEDELAKLPVELKVRWPEGNPWFNKDSKPAGTPLGPIQVEILNKKGESISRLPVGGNLSTRKFRIDLKVVLNSPKGDTQTNSHVGVHSSKWDYWFRAMENLNKIGKYTLHLQTILNESNCSSWAGRQLPSYTLNFSITEGDAENFLVRAVASPVQVGVPFSIPLELKDSFGHLSQPSPDLKPTLECSTLDVTYQGTAIEGTIFTIIGVQVKGELKSKVHTLNVVLPGLKQDTQSLPIAVIPGPPHSLLVLPEEDVVTVENRTASVFRVEVHDEARNTTTHSKLIVRCQLQDVPDFSVDAVDCSSTGFGQILGKPIKLKNVRTEQLITAKFDIPSHSAVPSVVRTLRVLPSKSVCRLEVYRSDCADEPPMILQDMERIDWTVGDVLGNLYYRLYDEGDRPIAVTPQLSQKIAVNWTTDMSSVGQGQLPPVNVTKLAQGEQFYQVVFKGNPGVETSFVIVPRPDEPDRLKLTLLETAVSLGESLSGKIYVELNDQYSNKAEGLGPDSVKDMSVSADGLDESSLVTEWLESKRCVSVSGVRFLSGPLGQRDVRITWNEFQEFARIRVTAGPPAKIVFEDCPEMPLQILNEENVDVRFFLQLCDEWGNPSPDPRVTVAANSLSACMKTKFSVVSQPFDLEAKAVFVLQQVVAPKGKYELAFTVSRRISALTVPITVLPNPGKPVELTVQYDTKAVFPAGGIFTVFVVTVLSEEGGAMRNINPAHMSMLLWKGDDKRPHPPAEASTLKCSKPTETEKEECFYFRDKVIPERVGKYTVQFLLQIHKTKGLASQQYVLDVVPNTPVKLVPDTPPNTPVVSNNDVLANRTLVKSLCLKIRDEYNNPTGEGCDGKVCVSVKSSSQHRQQDMPLFEGRDKTLIFPLKKGRALIENLALVENSPGLDGAEYILHFQPDVSGLVPFELPFRFYNDVENQKKMSTLTKKKDRLSQSIVIYRGWFETNQQLIVELKEQVKDAENKQKQVQFDLRKSGMDVTPLSTMAAIDAVVQQKSVEMERLRTQVRRTCTMTPYRNSPDVLGKIAHLALVEDDDAAKVISWHLLGDMDCVVTVTTAAARKIYDDTQGRQQVMPLETAFWKSSDKPLPHIRNGMNIFKPVGNPVFARDLLIFPQHAERCQIVFRNLLGDTILVDDLDSANLYRKGVVQNKIQCPTLLTRGGDRIRSNGKFGGLQNKAPPIEKLRGQVFGAPLPQQFHKTQADVALLQQYGLALKKSQEVQADYESHLQHMQSPEVGKKEDELREQEKELQDIENSLASTPVRPSPASSVKRVPPDEGEPSGHPAKRIRMKSRKLLD